MKAKLVLFFLMGRLLNIDNAFLKFLFSSGFGYNSNTF